MIIKNMPESERPREKLAQYGPGALSNAELIAAIIGSGTRGRSAVDIALEILANDGQGLGFLGRCNLKEILDVEGIGEAKGCQLLAAVELGRRIAAAPLKNRNFFENQDAVREYFISNMRYLPEEHFRVLLIDTHGHMISEEEVGIGDIYGIEIQPVQVFSSAMRKQAAAVIAAHNHPSGDCTPSEEDYEITRRLTKVGEIVGIPLLDHLIIGDGICSSVKYNQNY